MMLRGMMSPFILTTSRTIVLSRNLSSMHRGRIQRKTWCVGPCAGVHYNLTLCTLQSRLRHIYHGQPYARVVDFIPQSGTLDLAFGDLTIGTVITRPPVVSVENFHVKTEDQNRRRFLLPAKNTVPDVLKNLEGR